MWLLIIALAEAQRTQRNLFFLPLRSWASLRFIEKKTNKLSPGRQRNPQKLFFGKNKINIEVSAPCASARKNFLFRHQGDSNQPGRQDRLNLQDCCGYLPLADDNIYRWCTQNSIRIPVTASSY